MEARRNPFTPGAGTPPPVLAGRASELGDFEDAILDTGRRRFRAERPADRPARRREDRAARGVRAPRRRERVGPRPAGGRRESVAARGDGGARRESPDRFLTRRGPEPVGAPGARRAEVVPDPVASPGGRRFRGECRSRRGPGRRPGGFRSAPPRPRRSLRATRGSGPAARRRRPGDARRTPGPAPGGSGGADRGAAPGLPGPPPVPGRRRRTPLRPREVGRGEVLLRAAVRVPRDQQPRRGGRPGAALREPAEARGVRFHAEATDRILRETSGYPYFLQAFGRETWNLAPGPDAITPADAEAAIPLAVARLDAGFFRVRYDRVSPEEQALLLAPASLGEGPYRSEPAAAAPGSSPAEFEARVEPLEKRGLVFAPRSGEVAFTVPGFREFLLREAPRPTASPAGDPPA